VQHFPVFGQTDASRYVVVNKVGTKVGNEGGFLSLRCWDQAWGSCAPHSLPTAVSCWVAAKSSGHGGHSPVLLGETATVCQHGDPEPQCSPNADPILGRMPRASLQRGAGNQLPAPTPISRTALGTSPHPRLSGARCRPDPCPVPPQGRAGLSSCRCWQRCQGRDRRCRSFPLCAWLKNQTEIVSVPAA